MTSPWCIVWEGWLLYSPVSAYVDPETPVESVMCHPVMLISQSSPAVPIAVRTCSNVGVCVLHRVRGVRGGFVNQRDVACALRLRRRSHRACAVALALRAVRAEGTLHLQDRVIP